MTTTTIRNETVARLAGRASGRNKGEMMSRKLLSTVPPNLVYGTLVVLEKPEPIHKGRKSKRKAAGRV